MRERGPRLPAVIPEQKDSPSGIAARSRRVPGMVTLQHPLQLDVRETRQPGVVPGALDDHLLPPRGGKPRGRVLGQEAERRRRLVVPRRPERRVAIGNCPNPPTRRTFRRELPQDAREPILVAGAEGTVWIPLWRPRFRASGLGNGPSGPPRGHAHPPSRQPVSPELAHGRPKMTVVRATCKPPAVPPTAGRQTSRKRLDMEREAGVSSHVPQMKYPPGAAP